MLSELCINLPFKQDLKILFFFGNNLSSKIILFFFCINISKAFFSNSGEMTTSQKRLFIVEAVSRSILLFDISIPPNAETGSASRAAS